MPFSARSIEAASKSRGGDRAPNLRFSSRLALRALNGEGKLHSLFTIPARATATTIVYLGMTLSETDETLVLGAQRGDKAAFEELVRRTSRLAWARLYLETGDAHQAEDLLQETLLTAYRNLRQLTEPAKFRGWLLRIAQNAAIDASRRQQRRKRTPPDHVSSLAAFRQASTAPPPDEKAERDELREQVLGVLRGLPEEYRLPLTMRHLMGADHETIERQLGLTNGALRGLLHRGMKLLRDELKQKLGDSYLSSFSNH